MGVISKIIINTDQEIIWHSSKSLEYLHCYL
jgi:hypothetical protein